VDKNVAAFEHLTRREREVLIGLMRGATAGEISKENYVSLPTVRSQIRSILCKLGVNSQLAAVAFAYRSGWPFDRTDGGVLEGEAHMLAVGM
jgi:two-component system, NarL family, nitrate/nitrite response regulator NarL